MKFVTKNIKTNSDLNCKVFPKANYFEKERPTRAIYYHNYYKKYRKITLRITAKQINYIR